MKTKKWILTAVLVAVGYVGSSLVVVPLGFMRATPFQHMMNLLTSVLLGPWYSLAQAFGVSVLRNISGTGSLLAFPGSMIGAFLSGILYRHTKNMALAGVGEVFGTGILGSLACYPIVRLVLAQEAALFGFIPAFFISSLIGTIMGYVLLKQIVKRVDMDRFNGKPFEKGT